MSYFANEFFSAVYAGDIKATDHALEKGQAVDAFDGRSGMQALHIATGRDNLPLVKLLTEKWNASFGSDRRGRWPSLIAALCETSEEMQDYVAEQERKADNWPSPPAL